MKALTDHIVFAKVNGWEDTAMATHWGVSGYPTLILMTSDLKEVDRIPGFAPPQEFISSLDDFLAGRGTLDDYQSRWGQHPDSLSLLFEIAGKFQYRGNDAQAESCYAQVMTLDPGNAQGLSPKALHSMGLIAYSAGNQRYDTAIARFDAVITRYPATEEAEDAGTWVPYIMAKQNRYDEALARFDKFKLDHPQSTEIDWVNRQMADILKKKGAPAEGTL